MDLESKMAYAIPFNGNYYTVAGGETNIHVIHSQKEQQWNRIRVQFGDVNVADYVYMYKKCSSITIRTLDMRNFGHR